MGPVSRIDLGKNYFSPSLKVLTCLGIHLWERLHRLWQKLRAEEQTWQMLFYLGIDALRKSFEVSQLNTCKCSKFSTC